MMIPSIDLRGGSAVQLVQGVTQVIDAGDPRPIADRFGRVGDVAVIDLDAALGTGDNRAVILELLKRARCRVGGGIRDLDTARFWLNAGAEQIIIGTAATPALLSQLPRDRVIVALDARGDQVVIDGWRTRTGRTVESSMRALRPYVDDFMVTFVECEGGLGGLPLDRMQWLCECVGTGSLTVAGGVSEVSEIAAADALGVDVQVGMALYANRISIAEGLTCVLNSDRADGLWPTIVCNEQGQALGLAYSNAQSVGCSVDEGAGVHWSRSRNALWRKGVTSGATQKLVRVDVDCDRDALRFTVRQQGSGFCHQGTQTCFGDAPGLLALESTIANRCAGTDGAPYTRRLLDEPALLKQKLIEEAGELADASVREDAAWELADVLYFSLIAAARNNVRLDDAIAMLRQRALRVTRRSATEVGQ